MQLRRNAGPQESQCVVHRFVTERVAFEHVINALATPVNSSARAGTVSAEKFDAVRPASVLLLETAYMIRPSSGGTRR